MSSYRRYQCSYCEGAGVVPNGQKCSACSGRGWYERPAHIQATSSSIIACAMLTLVLWLMGNAGFGSVVVFRGLATICLGVEIISEAIILRGPEERGWNILMLVGTLLPLGGLSYLLTADYSRQPERPTNLISSPFDLLVIVGFAGAAMFLFLSFVSSKNKDLIAGTSRDSCSVPERELIEHQTHFNRGPEHMHALGLRYLVLGSCGCILDLYFG